MVRYGVLLNRDAIIMCLSVLYFQYFNSVISVRQADDRIVVFMKRKNGYSALKINVHIPLCFLFEYGQH